MGNQCSIHSRAFARHRGYGRTAIRSQLRIAGPPAKARNSGQNRMRDSNGTVAGAGDLLLGVKWRFFNSEKSQLQLGAYPQVLAPTGNHPRGLGEGRAAFVLPFLAQKNWEKWTVYGNIGYWWRGANEARDYFYAGAVLEREISEQLELGVELFGNSPKERGRPFRVGVQCRRHLEIE